MGVDAIYEMLPVSAQNLAMSLVGWGTNRRRFGAVFDQHLQQYSQQSLLSGGEVVELRDARLRRFIEHAVANVPYYGAQFRDSGIRPGDIQSLGDLQMLPVLQKATVQDRLGQFKWNSAGDDQVIPVHTSGSTGAGLKFISTLDAHQQQWAVWWRFRQWHGLSRDQWCLYFGGRSVVPLKQRSPPYWRVNRGGKQILFSAYHLGEQTAPAYLEEIKRHPNAWIHGYPSMVALLAGYALNAGIELPVRWVTLGAENLLPQQEALITKAFGVSPLQHYGLAEAVANASLCPNRNLHVDEDFAAVAFRRIEGDEYSIVGTNFSNPAFPLINYDTGDVATVTGRSCDCGRPGRIIDRIDGRKEDYVITRSGASLGRMDHIFKDQINVREAQIVQSRRGHIILKIVRGPGFSHRDESLIRDETQKRVGGDIDFDLEYVGSIPRTNSGKLRFVLSDGVIRDEASRSPQPVL